MLARNIQSHVAIEAIKYVQERDIELNNLKQILSLYTDKCANYDIKCKRYIQKHGTFEHAHANITPVYTLDLIDISDDEEKCDICSLKMCNKCCDKPTKPYIIEVPNVYDICDICYKQMCFNCINKHMTFCNDCKIACICKSCMNSKNINDNWTCNYCIGHPKWWENVDEPSLSDL